MVLTGLFNDADTAEIAYKTLSKRGYTQGEIFFAKLQDDDIDGRIVIGIRPRNRKDAEYFVNEWDSVFQHPRNSIRTTPEGEPANPKEVLVVNKPSGNKGNEDGKPDGKVASGVQDYNVKPTFEKKMRKHYTMG